MQIGDFSNAQGAESKRTVSPFICQVFAKYSLLIRARLRFERIGTCNTSGDVHAVLCVDIDSHNRVSALLPRQFHLLLYLNIEHRAFIAGLLADVYDAHVFVIQQHFVMLRVDFRGVLRSSNDRDQDQNPKNQNQRFHY